MASGSPGECRCQPLTVAPEIRNETADSFSPTADPSVLEAILETFVFNELGKSLPLLDASWQLYHWRMKDREVDIIAEAPGRRLALFEMKAAATVSRASGKRRPFRPCSSMA